MTGTWRYAAIGACLVLIGGPGSAAWAATRLETLDRYMDEIRKCTTEAGNLENSASMRENYSEVDSFGQRCWKTTQEFAAHLNRLRDNLEDRDNLRFANDSESFLKPYYVEFLARANDVRDDGKKRTTSKGSAKGMRLAGKELIDAYSKFRENVDSVHEGLKKSAEEKTRAWNDARADDEVDYRKATTALEEYIEMNEKALEKGAERVADSASASREWERANRSGKQEQIEKAWREYFKAHAALDRWEQDYERFSEKFDDIAEAHSRAWQKFVSETTKSFEIYDGEVASTNARLYEFEYHILGKR